MEFPIKLSLHLLIHQSLIGCYIYVLAVLIVPYFYFSLYDDINCNEIYNKKVVVMASLKSKQIVAGICLLVPSLIVLYYGSTSTSLYLLLIGFFGLVASLGIMGGFKNKLSSLLPASLSLLFFTHLFVLLIPTSLQIRFLSATSLFLLFVAFYFSLE